MKINNLSHLRPDENIHIIPRELSGVHIENEGCPCIPKWDEDNRRSYLRGEARLKVFIHKTIEEIKQ